MATINTRIPMSTQRPGMPRRPARPQVQARALPPATKRANPPVPREVTGGGQQKNQVSQTQTQSSRPGTPGTNRIEADGPDLSEFGIDRQGNVDLGGVGVNGDGGFVDGVETQSGPSSVTETGSTTQSGSQVNTAGQNGTTQSRQTASQATSATGGGSPSFSVPQNFRPGQVINPMQLALAQNYSGNSSVQSSSASQTNTAENGVARSTQTETSSQSNNLSGSTMNSQGNVDLSGYGLDSKGNINVDGVSVDQNGNVIAQGASSIQGGTQLNSSENGVSQSSQTGTQVNHVESGESQKVENGTLAQSFERYATASEDLNPQERAQLLANQDRARDEAITAAMNGDYVDFMQTDLDATLDSALDGLRQDPTNPRWGQLFDSTRELIKERIRERMEIDLSRGASSDRRVGVPSEMVLV